MKYKLERLKNLIINEIMNAITMDKVKDPRIPKLITLTRITLSKDLHYAHIYFTLDGDESKKKLALQGLNSAKGFFQKIISTNIEIKFTPKIEFRYDIVEEKANRVDKIIFKLEQERNKKLNNPDS